MSWGRKLALFGFIAIVIVALDLWTKDWIEARIAYTSSESVWGETFKLANHRNWGGMWGVGSDWSPWILRIVRLGAVFVILFLLREAHDRWFVSALGLVMGGAAGNIHDSLRFGYVRDFLLFDFDIPVFDPFPTFNVADSAICVGVGLLAIHMLLHPAESGSKPLAADRD